jgi:predicted nucleic acid-binding protein
VIVDTNVLIYLSKYNLEPNRVLNKASAISIITRIEVLGFKFQKDDEHQLLLSICNELKIIPLTDSIAEETIRIRRNNRVKLPDAIIFATALVEQVPLLTNNIKDFKAINSEVELINPFDL